MCVFNMCINVCVCVAELHVCLCNNDIIIITIHSFRPAPDPESGSETCFIKLVLEVINLCIPVKGGGNYNHFLQVFPSATIRGNFAEFLRILQISATS